MSQVHAFVINEDEVKQTLEANGWRELWTPGNWVHADATQPDTAGMPMSVAFSILMIHSNIGGKWRRVDKDITT